MEEGDETTSKKRMHASADKKLLTNLGPIIPTIIKNLVGLEMIIYIRELLVASIFVEFKHVW